MFETVGQAVLSLDILGLGTYLFLQSLCLGISIWLSNGEKATLLVTLLILNLSLGLGIMYIVPDDGVYFVLTAIVLTIVLITPGGWSEMIRDKITGDKK